MKNYTDENLSIIYDRAFVRLDNYNTGGPHYIPMVLKGKPNSTMYFHQDIFRVRRQKDKHWFRLVPEGYFGYAFTEDELKAVIRNDTGIKHKAVLSDGRELNRDEYADWFMKAFKDAQSLYEIYQTENIAAVNLYGTTSCAYIVTEDEFYKKIGDKYSEDFQLTFRKVQLNKPAPAEETIFVINLPPGPRFFQKFSSRTLFYSTYVSEAKQFKSESEVLRYIDKYSDRYFSQNGFEILEYVKRHGKIEKVQ